MMDRKNPIKAQGIPYTFAAFTWTGLVSNVDATLTGVAGIVTPQQGGGKRKNAMPLCPDLINCLG